jgi:hypothetical protein
MLDPLDLPDVPEAQRATAPVHLRYEDVTQDGRLSLSSIPYAIGEVVWRELLTPGPVGRAVSRTGVVPIVTTLVIEGGEGPIAVGKPLEGAGQYQLAHTRGPDGGVDKILLRLWTTLRGKRSRTHGPPPEGAGATIVAGRVFSESVFSHPFGPPERRRVTRLEHEGLPEVPDACVAFRPPEATLALPEGAEPLEDDVALDPALVAFGLSHTDSNQHVNSLVYPRLLEEAALRRLARLGEVTPLLPSRVEVGYRKPCFAGQRARLAVRVYRLGDAFGAVGAVLPEDAGAAGPIDWKKAHCYVRLTLAR